MSPKLPQSLDDLWGVTVNKGLMVMCPSIHSTTIKWRHDTGPKKLQNQSLTVLQRISSRPSFGSPSPKTKENTCKKVTQASSSEDFHGLYLAQKLQGWNKVLTNYMLSTINQPQHFSLNIYSGYWDTWLTDSKKFMPPPRFVGLALL